MERETVVFCKSFYDSAKILDDKTELQIYKAICEYAFYDNEIELEPVAQAVFNLIKPVLTHSMNRYDASVQNGKKGGRPRLENNLENNLEKPSNNLDITQLKPTQNLNKDKDKDKDLDKAVLKKNIKKKAPFVKPTVEEVRAYCQERKNNIDAEHFIDHYETNGWRVGKNPMKDWKASIRTWERNDYGFNNRTKSKTREYDPAELEYYSETSDF